MRNLRISINAGSAAVKAFKILKAFDPALELGPSLASLRSGEPIIDVDAEGVGAVKLLERLLEVLANIDAIDVPYLLEITDGVPEKRDGQPPVWPTKIGDRNDVVAALKEERQAEQRAEEEAERHRAWAASSEGQKYFETHARLTRSVTFCANDGVGSGLMICTATRKTTSTYGGSTSKR